MAVKKTFPILLDTKRAVSQSQRSAILVEGDTGNQFVITLTDNGQAVDLTDCRVAAVFSNANGTAMQTSWGASASITIGGTDDNEITIEVLSGSFANGNNLCEIQVYSDALYSTLITSAQFTFQARKAITNDETITSDSAYPILTDLITQVEALGDREQSDWDETDDTLGKFIKNKPVIGTDIQAPTDTLTAETTISDTDTVPFYDASATAHRKSTWSNIIAKIRTAFFGSVTGVAKLDGAGNVSAAAANTDFAAATHASRHASGAADAITPAAIGAAGATHKSNHAYGGSDVLAASDVGQYGVAELDANGKLASNRETLIYTVHTENLILATSDANHKLHRMSGAGLTVTINAGVVPVGAIIPFVTLLATDTFMFVAGAGVSLIPIGGYFHVSGVASPVLLHVAYDNFILAGCNA